jgi:hypothetical protein
VRPATASVEDIVVNYATLRFACAILTDHVLRYWLFPVLALLLISAATVYFLSPAQRPGPIAAIAITPLSVPSSASNARYIEDIVIPPTPRTEPTVAIAIAPPPPAAVAEAPSAPPPEARPAPAASTVPAPPKPEPRRAVTVDSFTPDKIYPLADWQLVPAALGKIDSVSARDSGGRVKSLTQLLENDVISASGWAGEGYLGIRFPYVLLSVCETVVATVRIGVPRPDIARSVHRNLANSGWQARLRAGDLPRCEEMQLRAYAIGGARRIVFPLNGEFAVHVSDSGTGPAFDIRWNATPITPAQIPETGRSGPSRYTPRAPICAAAAIQTAKFSGLLDRAATMRPSSMRRRIGFWCRSSASTAGCRGVYSWPTTQ